MTHLCSRKPGTNGLPRHFRVIEWKDEVRDALGSFVSLPCNDHDITEVTLRNRELDGALSVGLDEETHALPLRRTQVSGTAFLRGNPRGIRGANDAVEDSAKDGYWIFVPRIVARENDGVGGLDRYPTHLGALAGVGFASATECDEDSPVGSDELSRESERGRQCIRGVRVVDDDEWIGPDTLEASGDAREICEPAGDVRGCHADGMRRERGGE